MICHCFVLRFNSEGSTHLFKKLHTLQLSVVSCRRYQWLFPCFAGVGTGQQSLSICLLFHLFSLYPFQAHSLPFENCVQQLGCYFAVLRVEDWLVIVRAQVIEGDTSYVDRAVGHRLSPRARAKGPCSTSRQLLHFLPLSPGFTSKKTSFQTGKTTATFGLTWVYRFLSYRPLVYNYY